MITVVKKRKVDPAVFMGEIDTDDMTATWNVSGLTLADLLTAGHYSSRSQVEAWPRKAWPIFLLNDSPLAQIVTDTVPNGHLLNDIFAILSAGVPTEPGTVVVRVTADAAQWAQAREGAIAAKYNEDPFGYNFDLEYGSNPELGEFEDDDEEDWEHDDD